MRTQTTRLNTKSGLATRRTFKSTQVPGKKKSTGSEQKKIFAGKNDDIVRASSTKKQNAASTKKQRASSGHCTPPRLQTGSKFPVTETAVNSFAEREDESTSRPAQESSRRMNSSQPPRQQDEQAGNQETSINSDAGDETEVDIDAYKNVLKHVPKERRKKQVTFLDEDHVKHRASFKLDSSQADSSVW